VNSGEPWPVGMSAVSMMSLMPTGMPSSLEIGLPVRQRAVDFLQTGMDQGEIRKQDPAMLLFTLYTAVVGSLTEASVLNAVVGAGKGRASLKRREREVIAFVRAALQPID
jgi:hypothetical protein